MTAQGTPAIDLGRAAAAVLARQGVEAERLDPCTICDERFYSYRRDSAPGPDGRARPTGRQVGVIWLDGDSLGKVAC